MPRRQDLHGTLQFRDSLPCCSYSYPHHGLSGTFEADSTASSPHDSPSDHGRTWCLPANGYILQMRPLCALHFSPLVRRASAALACYLPKTPVLNTRLRRRTRNIVNALHVAENYTVISPLTQLPRVFACCNSGAKKGLQVASCDAQECH